MENQFIEFNLRQMPFEREKTIKVTYKDVIAGTHKLDFLVDDKVVLELKVVETILPIHVSQVNPKVRTVQNVALCL